MHFKTEILLQNMQIYASLYHTRVSLQECWEKYFKCNITPSLRALDFGVCKAIRLVRFSYNTFTGCVA